MLSTYLQQCCLLIVPDEHSDTASFSDIHTATAGLSIRKMVFTSAQNTFETWRKNDYSAQLLPASTLQDLWLSAFRSAFEEGFRKVILLSSTPKGLTQQHLQEAFLSLRILEVCMGPAKDGRLYLAGMNSFNPELLINSVLDDKPTWKALQRAVGAQKAAMYKLPVL